MAELYRKAKAVIVWLGPEDNSSLVCKEWLIANEMTLPTLPNAHKAVIGSPEYTPSWRFLILQDMFLKPDADPAFATAIAKFWARLWYVIWCFGRDAVCCEVLSISEVVSLRHDS